MLLPLLLCGTGLYQTSCVCTCSCKYNTNWLSSQLEVNLIVPSPVSILMSLDSTPVVGWYAFKNTFETCGRSKAC